MSTAVFCSGQCGEDAPMLVGLYDTLDEAMSIAPDYCGVVIADFDTGKVFSRQYDHSANEFIELNEDHALGVCSYTAI